MVRFVTVNIVSGKGPGREREERRDRKGGSQNLHMHVHVPALQWMKGLQIPRHWRGSCCEKRSIKQRLQQ